MVVSSHTEPTNCWVILYLWTHSVMNIRNTDWITLQMSPVQNSAKQFPWCKPGTHPEHKCKCSWHAIITISICHQTNGKRTHECLLFPVFIILQSFLLNSCVDVAHLCKYYETHIVYWFMQIIIACPSGKLLWRWNLIGSSTQPKCLTFFIPGLPMWSKIIHSIALERYID